MKVLFFDVIKRFISVLNSFKNMSLKYSISAVTGRTYNLKTKQSENNKG